MADLGRSFQIRRPKPTLDVKTRWNGEPCEAKRVRVIVADAPDCPNYWAREFVGQERNAVEVRYFDTPFYLDDENGSGWAKVTLGGGGPEWGHKGLEVAEVIGEISA
jgi:hypothetical protein